MIIFGSWRHVVVRETHNFRHKTPFTETFVVIDQSFELILSGRLPEGWTTSFIFVVDCPYKLHTIYSIIDIVSLGNLLFESDSRFLICPFVESKCWPFFETLLARSYLISCWNFVFQLLLVLSRCFQKIIVLNSVIHQS